MNSVMRTIDLTTKILAPVAIGALISYWSQMSGAIFIAGWNVVSCFAEIYLLHLIYKWMPQLGVKNSSQESHGKNPFKECWDGWCQYFRHSVLLAGLAFSCMFMTVLGFDQITIGRHIKFSNCDLVNVYIVCFHKTLIRNKCISGPLICRLHLQSRDGRKLVRIFDCARCNSGYLWKCGLPIFSEMYGKTCNRNFGLYFEHIVPVALRRFNFHDWFSI